MKKLYMFFTMMVLSALSFTAQAATATVYIDKPEAVMFYVYDGDWNQIELQNSGDTPNVIEFDEAKTQLFEFDPYNLNTGIYKITLNDEEVMIFNEEGYEVPGVKDGDVIRVQVVRPAGEGVTVVFEKGAEAIASVENADTEEVYTVTDNAFTAQMGDRIVLHPNSEYSIASVTLNGEAMTYIGASNCYFFQVSSETNVICVELGDVAPEENKTIAINANEMSALTFYTTSFYMMLGDPVEVSEGALVVSPNAPCLQFTVSDEYSVVSATYTTTDGATKEIPYLSWAKFYCIEDVFTADVAAINIVTEEKVIETINVTVWVENVEELPYYFIRTKDRKYLFDSEDAPYLQTGENTLTITSEQNPIMLCFETTNNIDQVYLNDEKVEVLEYDPSDNTYFGNVAVADGDILRIFTCKDTATPITNIATSAQNNKAYNLQGIEVKGSKLPAGLYIRNGKKMMVK